jgi:integrase
VAHIEKRAKRGDSGSTRWRARYIDPTGKERSKSFTRKVDAERFLKDSEARKLRGEWVDPRLSRTTLSDWADRWMATNVHLKPYTVAGYGSLIRTHIAPAFGPLPLDGIDTLAVREWVAGMTASKLSTSRVRQAYRVLSAMLKAAVESGYLAKNPCAGVKLPRTQSREMRFLSAQQVDALADAVGPAYRTYVYVLAYCGLRWGEAAALRRRHCDLLRGRIEVAESLAEVGGNLIFGATKTHRSAVLALPKFLRRMLAEHLDTVPAHPDALVFTAPKGGPLRHKGFKDRVWRPALAQAGLPGDLRVHDLRHTTVALLVKAGAHPKAVQRHMRHSSIQVTLDTYGHLFPDEQDRLARELDSAFETAQANVPRPIDGPLALVPSPGLA